ncbi:uncharacterized protein LOC129589620 isoform X2 [Paramacrobiotus metropolitanus]|uniref:uncharacterized protein LOC129589620 isoform X2 n=1 Tax=Paramacrobiotus metropolitanus TaxID=2943436 RepID=UPI0024462246|nr:uncharacterized protein LOC129589620 isoform X2 [Paramacrobiotus metropolitanus]
MQALGLCMGQVERLNQKLKRALAFMMANLDPVTQGLLWPYFLPSVQHLLNTTLHNSTNMTPFEVYKGYASALSLERIELDPVPWKAEHVSMLKRLMPEPPDDEFADVYATEQYENDIDEKAEENLRHLDDLPEPLRSQALHALEQLHYRRACMQTSVIENVERRLFKNIYGPAVKARQIRIEVGDVYIWRPHQKKTEIIRSCKGEDCANYGTRENALLKIPGGIFQER